MLSGAVRYPRFVDGDVAQAAKGLLDFAKANPLLVIKGRACLDGKALSASEGRQARRPGAARGAAGQAGRRDEGDSGQGGWDVQTRWPTQMALLLADALRRQAPRPARPWLGTRRRHRQRTLQTKRKETLEIRNGENDHGEAQQPLTCSTRSRR